MRQRIVEAINHWSGTTLFTYLVPNYLIMVCLGAFAGTLWAVRRARARGLDPDPLYGFILWTFPVALLGGRLMQWLLNPAAYPTLLSFFDPTQGDSAAYGGFLAGAAFGITYLACRTQDVWRYLDCMAPALGLATALTRLGCFLDGCCFGAATSLPWGVQFPPATPAFFVQVEAGTIASTAAATVAVHPAQLYLALKGASLVALAVAYERRPRAPGETFFMYWMLYAGFRFLLELTRGDGARGFIGPLSASQAISIAVLAVAAAGFGLRRTRRAAAA